MASSTGHQQPARWSAASGRVRESFSLYPENPNKIRSLIGGFCNGNLVNFHNPDGSGYEFLKQRILILHSRNPQVAARLMTPLTRWKKFPEPNSSQMREALQVIADEQGLVKDIYEIAIKSL